MYKIIKHKWTEKDDLFFFSDPHVFHDPTWDSPLWQTRGYESAAAAAKDKIEKINAKVGKDQILYCLGDGFLNATDEQCLDWLAQINCQNIRYLFGNHESNMYRLYKKTIAETYPEFGPNPEVEIYPIRMKNVIFYGNHMDIEVGKQKLVLNHFPLHSWNSMGMRKSWMLSGHQHNTDKSRNPDAPINRCIDIGWDWKRDVWSYSEIEDVMSTKTFEAVDHHTTQV